MANENENLEKFCASFTLPSEESQFLQAFNNYVKPTHCGNEEKNDEIYYDNYDGLSSDDEVFSNPHQQQQYYNNSSAKNICDIENNQVSTLVDLSSFQQQTPMAISNNYEAQPLTSNSNNNMLASSSSLPPPPPQIITSSAATLDLDLLFKSMVDVLHTNNNYNEPITPASEDISSPIINPYAITPITTTNNNTTTNQHNRSSITQPTGNRPYYRRKNCSSDVHDQSIDRYITAIIDERIAYFQKIIPKLDSERTKESMREYIVNRIKDLLRNAIPKDSYFIITQD